MPIETPYLTVDVVVRLERAAGPALVLIRRRNPPLGLALPGGFVDRGERVEDAARRELEEETGLRVEELCLLGVYSDPRRDPRFHTVSVVYGACASEEPRAGDDALEVVLAPLDALPLDEMVFDHRQIVEDWLRGGAGAV